jgi:hypothetical protein
MTTSPFVLSKDRINRLPLERLTPWLRDIGYLLHSPGQEHYRLLAYLSTRFDGRIIFDVGTSAGHSALALSWNGANRVISLDIGDYRAIVNEASLPNIEFRIGDCTEQPEILEACLVFLDTSPHDGIYEKKVYDCLVAGGFRGLLVMDDIASYQFPGLREFWDTIDVPKMDLTLYGHHSGTGLVNFGGSPIGLG